MTQAQIDLIKWMQEDLRQLEVEFAGMSAILKISNGQFKLLLDDLKK